MEDVEVEPSGMVFGVLEIVLPCPALRCPICFRVWGALFLVEGPLEGENEEVSVFSRS